MPQCPNRSWVLDSGDDQDDQSEGASQLITASSQVSSSAGAKNGTVRLAARAHAVPWAVDRSVVVGPTCLASLGSPARTTQIIRFALGGAVVQADRTKDKALVGDTRRRLAGAALVAGTHNRFKRAVGSPELRWRPKRRAPGSAVPGPVRREDRISSGRSRLSDRRPTAITFVPMCSRLRALHSESGTSHKRSVVLTGRRSPRKPRTAAFGVWRGESIPARSCARLCALNSAGTMDVCLCRCCTCLGTQDGHLRSLTSFAVPIETPRPKLRRPARSLARFRNVRAFATNPDVGLRDSSVIDDVG